MLKPLKQHQYEKQIIYGISQNLSSTKTNIECPHCEGVELLNLSPGMINTSYPPSYSAQCPKCKKIQYITI